MNSLVMSGNVAVCQFAEEITYATPDERRYKKLFVLASEGVKADAQQLITDST